MGSNLAKAVGAVGRKDCLMMPPGLLVVITDPNHVLFEEGAVEPLDAGFVENIKAEGVIETIECRRNGDTLEVVAGRKRTRAAVAAGLDRVPVIVSGGTDVDFFRRMVSENEARKDPSIRTRGALLDALDIAAARVPVGAASEAA